MNLVAIPQRASVPGERNDVEQKNVGDSSRQDGALDNHTDGNGLTGVDALLGSRPKTFLTVSTTLGIRDIPQTRVTSLTSLDFKPAWLKAFLQGSIMCWMKGSMGVLNWKRRSLRLMWWKKVRYWPSR